MNMSNRGNYRGSREWFRNILKNENAVLCHTSALECLGQFPGYVNETQIDIYVKSYIYIKNVNCYVVEEFSKIDIVNIDGLYCTSFNQTINDMLRDYDIIDEQSLVQALADFYSQNGNSFEGLQVESKYEEQFNKIRDWAVEFYEYG